jgi:hypothetical protein
MTASRPKYTKIPTLTGGSSYFFIENSPETDIILIHFVRNRSRLKKFYNRPFCVVSVQSSGSHI